MQKGKIGNQNAVGHAPKAPYTDRKKAANVRNKLLDLAISTLETGTKAKKWELLMKMSGSLLPKLQEITGEDGERLVLTFDSVFKKNVTTPEAKGDSTE